MKRYLPILATGLIPLLTGCQQQARSSGIDQYGSASSLQGTPLHDQVPLVGYDGTLQTSSDVDVAAVPVFTPIDMPDRARNLVAATITRLVVAQGGSYSENVSDSSTIGLAYNRLGQSGSTAMLGGYEFGLQVWSGSANSAASDYGDIVHEDRLMNYALYRVGGSPPAATQIHGDIVLPGMNGATKARQISIIRMDGDYYKLTVQVFAQAVAPFGSDRTIGTLTQFPDEGSGSPALNGQYQSR